MAVCWQTEDVPAAFEVLFGENGAFERKAEITKIKPYRSGRQIVVNYVATASGLKLGMRYTYRVMQNGVLVAEGYFTTRKPRGAAMRFVSFGDNSYGDLGQRAVAFYAYKSLPNLVMNTGDNVYGSGRNSEYFFPIHSAEMPSAGVGTSLPRSVPFYMGRRRGMLIGSAAANSEIPSLICNALGMRTPRPMTSAKRMVDR